MGRLLTIALATTAAGLELVTPDVDLIRYGITQGGLFLVILFVLWSYRRDFRRIVDRDEERLQVFAGIVQGNTTAMVQMTEALGQQKEATHRLAHAVERLEDGRR